MDDILKSAPVVHITYGPAHAVELYVRELSRVSGQPCDWGYFAGRAVIHSGGDINRIAQAVNKLRWLETSVMLAPYYTGGE